MRYEIKVTFLLDRYSMDDEELEAYLSNVTRDAEESVRANDYCLEASATLTRLKDSDAITCGRCGGVGHLCRGCSGLARDHPELFGSCGIDVECPDCEGMGWVTVGFVLSHHPLYVRRFYAKLLNTPGSPLVRTFEENERLERVLPSSEDSFYVAGSAEEREFLRKRDGELE